MTCRGKAMHALGECDYYFKPRDFVELVENERQCLAAKPGSGTSPRTVPEGEAVAVMLRDRARWLRELKLEATVTITGGPRTSDGRLKRGRASNTSSPGGLSSQTHWQSATLSVYQLRN